MKNSKLYLFLLVISLVTPYVTFGQNDIEKFSTAREFSFPNGFQIVDFASGSRKTVKSVSGPSTANIQGTIRKNGKKYYLSDWSIQQLSAGKKFYYIDGIPNTEEASKPNSKSGKSEGDDLLLYLEKAQNASRNEDWSKACDYYLILRNLCKKKGDEELYHQANNLAVMLAFRGLKDRYAHGIPGNTFERIVNLEPPIVKPDWEHFLSYSHIQLYAADYLVRRDRFNEAQRRYAEGVTFWEKTIAQAPDSEDMRTMSNWYRGVERQLRNQLDGKGVIQGTYVQNKGIRQLWIGKVLSIKNGRTSIRLTYVSNQAPRGFRSGEVVEMLRNEIAVAKRLSFDALTKGYR